MVTLEDVALEVGCSVNTVSRALNGKPDVSKETKRRVLEAAQKLGYVPNTLAKSLVTRMSGTIGIVLPRVEDPLYAELLSSIEEKIVSYNYSLILTQSGPDEIRQAEIFEMLCQKRVDGLLIVAHDQSSMGLEAITRYRLPAVFALHNMPSSDHSFVGIDDEKAMYVATRHLLEKGRRRIALLKSPSTSMRGMQGYIRALEEYGLSCGEELRVPIELKARSGYDGCRRLIRENVGFDGMVLPHDILFPGIIKALEENGLSCPGDVSVVGYGNMDLCPFFPVPLTSIGLQLKEIGLDALQVLMNAINIDRFEEEASVQMIHRIIRDPELIIRESS